MKKSPQPGWIVRVGTQVVVGFRHPDHPRPGQKPAPFKAAANEVVIAASCIAVLGTGRGFEWPEPHKSSAEQCAASVGRRRPYVVGSTGAKRKHPLAKVGDVFGDFEVIEIAPRDASLNERVRVRCKCGHERLQYVFNLRRQPTCSHRHTGAR